MGSSHKTKLRIAEASITRQVGFHQLLVAARKTWLGDALSHALESVDQRTLKKQILAYAADDVLRVLASAGVRDEHVYPTPVVLEAKPTLVGYYRLLLGVPQKGFYSGTTGMARLKSMEMSGVMSPVQRALLPEFCKTMGTALSDLVRQMSPTVTPQDIHELPLLILGSYFQGRKNVSIGKQATADVFLAIADVVKAWTEKREERKLAIRNAAGRLVLVSLGSDPDVCIQEEFGDALRNKVAIEIKGGTDRSNAHNRAGEAEKSHQKAQRKDYRDFWTLIAKKGLDLQKLRSESPSTKSWFDVAQVLARTGEDWEDFRSRLSEVVSIPLADD